MHVIDDPTMQDLLRFVKAHHTFARHSRVIRERMLHLGVMIEEMKAVCEKYSAVVDPAEARAQKAKHKKA